MSEQKQTISERFDQQMFDPPAGKTFSSGAGPVFFMQPADYCARFSLRIPVEHLKKAVNAFGCDLPENIGEMSSGSEKTALCLGPDEWLLLAPGTSSPDIVSRFAELGKTTIHSLVDVSHRTTGIEISGPLATVVLNSGCPLDLENMPVGHCTRSLLDKAEIILMKLNEQHYRLEIVRSFAPFVWAFLQESAEQHESQVPL
jgi:sarcosine oxidase, subunit gamma